MSRRFLQYTVELPSITIPGAETLETLHSGTLDLRATSQPSSLFIRFLAQ